MEILLTLEHAQICLLVVTFTAMLDVCKKEECWQFVSQTCCWAETEWASLLESNTFSYRFTQHLNMLCFELTSQCHGSVPFYSHVRLQQTHLAETAVNGLTIFGVCMCVYHCHWGSWMIFICTRYLDLRTTEASDVSASDVMSMKRRN